MREEEIAHIVGWDFSHIDGRYREEEDIPWDYKAEILSGLKPEMRLLDIDTGGAVFSSHSKSAQKATVSLCGFYWAICRFLFPCNMHKHSANFSPKPVSRSKNAKNISAVSAFLIQLHSSGLHASSNGNSLAFRRKAVCQSFLKRRSFSKKKAKFPAERTVSS